jgi:tetratricopeptide (TPR) repeat protein
MRMESRHYILPSERLPRLELVCGTNWRYVRIHMDGTQVGSIGSAGDLLRGAEFFLPDGSVLAVKLIKQVGASELRVTLNGQPLMKPGLDRSNHDVKTAYRAVLAIGGVNLVFFCLSLLTISMPPRWYDLGFGVTFLLLGWLVREGSGVALTSALVIHVIDTVIALIAIVGYQYYAAAFDVSINVVLLVFMLQGYGSFTKATESFSLFGRMLRNAPEKRLPAPTSYTDDQLTPALARARDLLRQAARLYTADRQLDRARKLVKQALEIAPTLADGWYVLAAMVEQPDDRLRALERVLAIDPFHAGANDALDKLRRGREYVDGLLRGEVSNTVEATSALRADPEDAEAWFMAHFLTQVPEKRRAVLEQAVKYDPTHKAAKQALVHAKAADTSFGDLTAPTWTPDMRDLIATAVAGSGKAHVWEGLALRLLIGMLVVMAGMIFVVVILSS